MTAPTHPSFLAQTVHGRGAVLVALAALVDDGGGSALALVGEAGIGKTRLAAWAADHARQTRRTVIEGRSVLGLAEPLGVFCDLVRGARREGLEPPARDPLAAGFPAQVLPELGASDVERGNLGATFEAAARYLRALAGRRGVLVVLEDLHWADATSLTLVPFLARTLTDSPVRLLLTYRSDEDLHAGRALEALRSELRRSRLAEELPLGPLAPGDAAAMLTEVFGRRPSPDVETELVRLAGGNPFALEELARAAVDSGWLDLDSGRRRGTSSVSVPWTLAESIRARAERLAPAERELLDWAAAIGGRFDVRLLAAASDCPPEDALTGVAGLVGAGLVVEAPGDASGHLFAFRHTLVHEALSQEGLLAQRRSRQARVLAAAEAMLTEGTLEISAAELARHAMAAGDRERTLRHSRAAVARAQELGAVREAVEHLERALSLWSEEDGRALRAELLFACGRLRVRLARGDERAVELLRVAVDEYEGLGDEPAALWCLSVLADARFEAGDRTQALLDWERSVPALRRLGPPEALRTALVGYSRGLALSGRMAPAASAADEGLALVPVAHDSSDAAERTNLLITRGLVELFRYRREPGHALILEAIGLATAHHDDVGVARGNHIFAAGQPLLLTVQESLTRYATAAELVERHGLGTLQAFYLTLSGATLIDAGEWAAAERHAGQATALVEGLERAEWVRNQVIWINGLSRLGRGDLEGARRTAEALLSDTFSSESRGHGNTARQLLATVSLLEGDPRRAAQELEPYLEYARGLADEGESHDLEESITAVEVLVGAGRAEEADEIAGAIRGTFPSPWSDYCLAIAGDGVPPELAVDVEAAAGAVEAGGWRWAGARMRLVAATVLSGRPEGRGPAVSLARAAMERFREMGSDGWVRRIEEMLRRLGERAPTRAGAGAGGLSARELEVLGLVAEGLTNRQIAERLVISEHTAIRHVANVFRKLGANNRATAVRMATQQGLLGAGMATSPGHE